MMKSLRFSKNICPKPTVSSLLDATTTLTHYCQVNFLTDIKRLAGFIPPRFEPTTITTAHGEEKAVISAVVFQERSFRFLNFPMSTVGEFTFNQTNYRTYCIDKETGRQTVWFFGTTLDHWSLVIPRYVWRFPWHKASINFDCNYSHTDRKYNSYRMTAKSDWGPAEINVIDSGREVNDQDFPGFPDSESALIYLTHPMSGHFHLRGWGDEGENGKNGKNSTSTSPPSMGCWEIWHPQMRPHIGHLDKSKTNFFGLYERQGLIDRGQDPYNILIQREINYDIYLPPIQSISKGSRYVDPIDK